MVIELWLKMHYGMTPGKVGKFSAPEHYCCDGYGIDSSAGNVIIMKPFFRIGLTIRMLKV